jgi:hypothetical protein
MRDLILINSRDETVLYDCKVKYTRNKSMNMFERKPESVAVGCGYRTLQWTKASYILYVKNYDYPMRIGGLKLFQMKTDYIRTPYLNS